MLKPEAAPTHVERCAVRGVTAYDPDSLAMEHHLRTKVSPQPRVAGVRLPVIRSGGRPPARLSWWRSIFTLHLQGELVRRDFEWRSHVIGKV